MASLPVTWTVASRQAAVLLDEWSLVVAVAIHFIQLWPTCVELRTFYNVQ